MPDAPLLELSSICKRFPGVQALDHVDFCLEHGEVHGLVGENGAGKSTLMNVIGGVVLPDEGTIHFRGQPVQIQSPRRAQELGIAFIHQELSVFPNLDVASNIYMASLPRMLPGMINSKAMREQARGVLARVGLSHIDPSERLERLSPGERQLVEIARSLAQNTEILVLDEPTSSLTGREVETLFAIIRELKGQGVSIIYVSHRLDEVFEVCDRVTVLRDGKKIGTAAIGEIERNDLVEMILGHEAADACATAERSIGESVLRIEGLSRGTVLHDINLDLHAGEILGITGLLGSGRTEFARAIFGLDGFDSGTISVNGKPARIRNPRDAIKHGIGFITEDRRDEGVLAEKPLKDNIVLASLSAVATRWGWALPRREFQAAESQRTNLRIASPSVMRLVKFLSGGNQQKVVLGKWLQTTPSIFLLDEPTRGIDVGAKEEVYRLIRELAKEGAGVLFISSEIPETMLVSDRILVMHRGKIVASFTGGQCTAQEILLAAIRGVS